MANKTKYAVTDGSFVWNKPSIAVARKDELL